MKLMHFYKPYGKHKMEQKFVYYIVVSVVKDMPNKIKQFDYIKLSFPFIYLATYLYTRQRIVIKLETVAYK